jgi:hypothetical protein
MITIKNFLLRIASNLIKLYPPQFHREFSEEIQITLHELLEEYANCGIPVLLMKGLSEIFSLFVSIFRERQRTLNMREAKMKHIQWSWKKVVTTLLPILLWIGILWFIQPNVFFSSGMVYQSPDGSAISRDQFLALLPLLGKIQILVITLNLFSPFSFGPVIFFILFSLLIIGLGWWDEKRIPMIGLPILGMITYFAFIAIGNLLKISTSLKGILSGIVPLFLLLLWLGWSQWGIHRKLPKSIWRLFIALPLVAVATIVGSYLFNNILHLQLNFNQPIGNFGRQVNDALFIIGPTAFAMLIGLLYAQRYGSSAILFVAGFMCFAMMTPLSGLEANGGIMATSIGLLGFEQFQAVQSILFIAAFFLVIPALYLSSPTPLTRWLSVLLPVAIVFVVMVIVQGYEEGWTGHLILLLGNLIQGLIGLGLAIQLYEYLYRTPETNYILSFQIEGKSNPKLANEIL